jgi:N-methylhydantoinase A
VEEAAAGILRVANATMSRAVRVVSVERGYDPRDFALVAFGGCGGLHACEMAEDLGIGTVLAPRLAGALSALGMLLADRVRDYALGALGRDDVEAMFARLEEQARAEMPGAKVARSADLRYRGQSYELTVPWGRTGAARRFHALHEKTYGYANEGRAVEVVTVRVRARVGVKRPPLVEPMVVDGGPVRMRRVYAGGRFAATAVYERGQVGRAWISGPALVVDYGSTTLIPPGWRMKRDGAGTLVLERAGGV